MASAVLANRTEPDWSQPKRTSGGGSGPKFMGKVPFSKPNTKFPKKRQFHHAVAAINNGDIDEIFPQSAASDDASSINRKPSEFSGGGRYINFNIASYTKKELLELRNRLIVELEQIRQIKNQIDSNESSQIRSNSKKSSKKFSGNKRALPTNFGRLNPENGMLMKNCSQILTKLMKHKYGYIFNSPVDVVDMGLHDYFDVIKNPMDLGTVKSNLGKNLYDSPLDFAADVKLTFSNAMLYNPKGHEVYILAEQLLARFEELFRPLSEKLGVVEVVEEEEEEERREQVYDEELQASSWNRVEPPPQPQPQPPPQRVNKERENFMHIEAKSEPLRAPMASGSNPTPPLAAAPVRTPSPMRVPPVKPVKQPKPKAKDPNKREMSMEEKHRLGVGLQSLPQEKMEHVVQIIRKRNGHLRQDGDEIELDIEAVDTETLWELDRFVTNYKKMVSKIKRQALMGNNVTAHSEGNRELPVSEKIEVVAVEAKKPKKGEAGEEDVDIGDEMPMTSFPPVEIEKDNGHASSSSSGSSSSSSGSSSSSDSDSGSSSGSDSDEDDARS